MGKYSWEKQEVTSLVTVPVTKIIARPTCLEQKLFYYKKLTICAPVPGSKSSTLI